MISLGIDTSNYTTSVALFDGTDYTMSRKIIDVGEGMRGIRQSDGVFIHNKELPDMIKSQLKDIKPDVVGVSTRPRALSDSYMPVFTVGSGYATAISSALGVKLHSFSHQDGHIMAGIHSADAYDLLNMPFLSVHMSGGTTEILSTTYNGFNFHNKIIGGTLDINIGQLMDRVGVSLGIKFPCGAELEKLAEKTDFFVKLPMSVKDASFNLSGVETMLLRGVDKDNSVVARSVFIYIKNILIKALKNATAKTGISKILFVGGVASNQIIRDGIISEFGNNAYFASKELSSDNAVGVAILAHLAEVN